MKMMKKVIVISMLSSLPFLATAEPLSPEKFKEMQGFWDVVLPDSVQLNYKDQANSGDLIGTIGDNGGQKGIAYFSPSASWDLYEKSNRYKVDLTLGIDRYSGDASFKSYGASIDQNHKNIYGDISLYFTKAENVNPYVQLGVGYNTIDATIYRKANGATVVENIHESGLQPRIGVGFKININKYWNTGIQFNYQAGNESQATTSAYIRFNF